jgi:putative MATE family efflux protein
MHFSMVFIVLPYPSSHPFVFSSIYVYNIKSVVNQKKQIKDSSILGTMPIGKLIKQIALPASIAMLVTSTYNLTDAIYVGRGVGAHGLGALTLLMPFQMMIMGLGNLFAIGTSSVVSRALGAHRPELVRKAVGTSYTAAIVTGLITLFLGWVFTGPVLRLLGATAELEAPTRAYYRIIIIAEPVIIYNLLANGLIRAEGRARIAMVTMVAGMLTNIILDPIFIFLFDWGIQGAAWATITGRLVTTVLILRHVAFGKTDLRIGLSHLNPNMKLLWEIITIGFSGFIRQVSTGFVQTVRNNLLMTMGGGIYIAALGASFRSIVFLAMPAMGIAQALSPIAGYNYGAEKYDRVRRALWLSLISCTIFMGVGFLVCMIFPRFLLGLFSTNPVLLEQGVWILRVSTCNLLFFSAYFIAPAFYQSLGKPVQALFLSLSRPVMGIIFVSLGAPLFGVPGIIAADPAALVVSALAAVLFLHRDLKKLLPEND